jgi:hypothetical protein
MHLGDLLRRKQAFQLRQTARGVGEERVCPTFYTRGGPVI